MFAINSRRSFIKNFGLVCSYGFLEPSMLSNFKNIGNNRKIKIGVVGIGSRGFSLVKTLLNSSNFKVVACCDIFQWKLIEVSQLLSNESRMYQNYIELINDDEVEAVVIAVPLFLHYKISIEALKAGKHVYCEKTMTYNSDEACNLNSLAERSKNFIFQVGYQFRYSSLYAHIVKMYKNGSIGKLIGIHCFWNRNGNWRSTVDNIDNEKIINWRMYRSFSKGLLGELSSHQIDFVNWLTGEYPKSAIGTGGIDYWIDGRETYDNVNVIFEYPNGVKASFSCSTANAYGGYRIFIFGDKGTIELEQNSARIYPEYENYINSNIDIMTGATAKYDYKEGIPIKIFDTDPTASALDAFADNIYNNKVPKSNVNTGKITSIAVEMALKSIDEKRRVTWDEFNCS